MNEYVLILCLTLTAVAVTKVYTGINHIYTLAVTLGSARGKIKFSFFWQSPEAATFDWAKTAPKTTGASKGTATSRENATILTMILNIR